MTGKMSRNKGTQDVLALIRKHDGVQRSSGRTCSEIVDELDSSHRTISGRLSELQQGGWIEWTGETRNNERGNAEQIYIAKAAN